MSLSSRLILCAAAIGLGAAAHHALVWHLEAAPEGAFLPLRAELASFPNVLVVPEGESYQGQEHPGKPELLKQVPFADEVLYRVYRQGSAGETFLLYAAYSIKGEDRKHHPEVCLREAAGLPEDLAARKLVPLRPGENVHAQRFRFRTGTGASMNLYYWHYTLPTARTDARSGLQALHQRLVAAAPSITFQATSYAQGESLERFEAEALPAIDAALRQGILPEGCAVGCDRIPITFLRR
jgi:hypothetical protein